MSGSLSKKFEKIGISKDDVRNMNILMEGYASEANVGDPLDSRYVTRELLDRIVNLPLAKLESKQIESLLSEFKKKVVPEGDASLREDTIATLKVLRTAFDEACGGGKKKMEMGDDEAEDDEEEMDSEDEEDMGEEDESCSCGDPECEGCDEGDMGESDEACSCGDPECEGCDDEEEMDTEECYFSPRLDRAIDEANLSIEESQFIAAAYASGLRAKHFNLSEALFVKRACTLIESFSERDSISEASNRLEESRIRKAIRAGKMIFQKATSAAKKMAGRAYRKIKKSFLKRKAKIRSKLQAMGKVGKGVKATLRKKGISLSAFRKSAKARLRNSSFDVPADNIGESRLARRVLGSLTESTEARSTEQHRRIMSHLRESFASCATLFSNDKSVASAIEHVYNNLEVDTSSDEAFHESIKPALTALQRLVEQMEVSGTGTVAGISVDSYGPYTKSNADRGITGASANGSLDASRNNVTFDLAALSASLAKEIRGIPMNRAYRYMESFLEDKGIDADSVPASWYRKTYQNANLGN